MDIVDGQWTIYGKWTFSSPFLQSHSDIQFERMANQKSLLTFQTHLLFLHLVKYTGRGWVC